MQFVYVLTTNGYDYLIETTYLSVWSARYHNPQAKILLAVDPFTNKYLEENNPELLHYIDDIIVFDVPESYDSVVKSRYIKTKLREILSGDFFYIDSDTIITNGLEEPHNLNADFAAVPDWMIPVKDWSYNIFHLAQQRVSIFEVDLTHEDYYYNSGIIWYADTKVSRHLAHLWHTLYIQHQSKILLDQPSLCKANISCSHIIKSLPDIYNCQMNAHPSRPDKACILHFAANSRKYSWLYSAAVMEKIRTEGIKGSIIVDGVLNPLDTCITTAAQCANMSFTDCLRHIKKQRILFRRYAREIDSSFSWIESRNFQMKLVRSLLKYRLFLTGAFFAVFPRWVFSKTLLRCGHSSSV